MDHSRPVGDVYPVPPDADPKEHGHVIGAAIFRSPEAMLNLRWGTPTDIWSFGATVCTQSYHRLNPTDIMSREAYQSDMGRRLAYLYSWRHVT